MSADEASMREGGAARRPVAPVSFAPQAALVAGLFGLCWFILWPSAGSLISEWQDTNRLTYTHGWLILLISAWLALRSFRAIEVQVRFSRVAAVLLVLGSILWLVMLRARIEIGHQALLPVLMALTVWAALGPNAARSTWFSFAYLYFAIPVWSLANGVLQALTVVAVKVLLPLFGISAFVTGNTVHIASGVFEIAGGCSGLHFFIVAIAIAALLGELDRDSWRTRILLLLLAAVVAMVSNWLRVFTIIAAGYLTDMQHFLITVDHYYFGWVLFAVSIIVFFLLARRLGLAGQPQSPEHESPARAVHLDARAATVIAAAFLLLAAGPIWNLLQSPSAAALPGNAELPRAPAGWTGPLADSGEDGWRPVFNGADVIRQGVYRDGANEVSLFTAVYLSQEQGTKELIGFNNSVLGETAATVIGNVNVGDAAMPVREMSLREADNSQSLLWYFYEVDARRLTSPFMVQFWYGVHSMVSVPVARVVAVRARCRPDCDSQRRQLADFLTAAYSNEGS